MGLGDADAGTAGRECCDDEGVTRGDGACARAGAGDEDLADERGTDGEALAAAAAAIAGDLVTIIGLRRRKPDEAGRAGLAADAAALLPDDCTDGLFVPAAAPEPDGDAPEERFACGVSMSISKSSASSSAAAAAATDDEHARGEACLRLGRGRLVAEPGAGLLNKSSPSPTSSSANFAASSPSATSAADAAATAAASSLSMKSSMRD